MGMGPEGEASFSRSGISGASKLTERVDIPISEELKAELAFLAVASGRPTSEYAREVLEAHVFGESFRIRKMVRLGIANSHPRNDG